jgi:hypothetical protein
MSKTIRVGFGGVVLVVVGRLAASGRLPRNILAGIRLPSTMRSDEAWRAGHDAAASALTLAGCGPMVAAAAVGVTRPAPEAQKVLVRLGTAWMAGWLGLATVRAHRAARAVASA